MARARIDSWEGKVKVYGEVRVQGLGLRSMHTRTRTRRVLLLKMMPSRSPRRLPRAIPPHPSTLAGTGCPPWSSAAAHQGALQHPWPWQLNSLPLTTAFVQPHPPSPQAPAASPSTLVRPPTPLCPASHVGPELLYQGAQQHSPTNMIAAASFIPPPLPDHFPSRTPNTFDTHYHHISPASYHRCLRPLHPASSTPHPLPHPPALS